MASKLKPEEVAGIAERIDRLASGSPAEPRRDAPFRRVLVATDGSAASDHALAWARAIGQLGAPRVWLVHVATRGSSHVLRDAMRALDLPAADGLLAFGDPAAEIAKLARELRADLVIVGTHGASAASRFLLGSVADAVRNKVHASVLLARAPPPSDPVLVAVDGSPPATRAAGLGAALAEAWGSGLALLHVERPGILRPDLRAGLGVDVQGRLTEIVAAGDPARRILDEAAARDAALVVMGARGLGRIRGAIMGSVSTKVCRDARASVLVVRGDEA